MFRDEGGNIVNPEKKLKMTLSDFAPSDVLGESSSHPVALTHEQLFHLVEASEARHQMLETRQMRLQVTDEMREMPQKKRERTPDSAVTASDDPDTPEDKRPAKRAKEHRLDPDFKA